MVASIGCSLFRGGFQYKNHYPRFRGAPFHPAFNYHSFGGSGLSEKPPLTQQGLSTSSKRRGRMVDYTATENLISNSQAIVLKQPGREVCYRFHILASFSHRDPMPLFLWRSCCLRASNVSRCSRSRARPISQSCIGGHHCT